MDEANRLMLMNDDNQTGMAIDCFLPSFISLCEKLDDKEVFIIAANNALQRIKNQDCERRERRMAERKEMLSKEEVIEDNW